ncbi:Gfo/Idh/MocA family protein [Mechercharimyces sp. CAU 1602]|uniref:Gfo/Idh/MocA family protein n=1 Tax=Mechercharimyces sp. CAU 1602 TaxID=2973933 RepID=UPI0021622ECB|nr:Gfo/Idh/MocA family oxidoreductase [Mechercharimyces sp. CAU 1602]MCS1352255.1 Gfo/Idh/MocA family oxidoreductase [Mechercharimyces sp. CAU 1602]
MIRYGIVGCGHIASAHIQAITKAKGAVLTALCDRDPKRLAVYKDEGVALYTDFEEMVRTAPVDVINICTPSGLHAEQTVIAAEAGKHVIVEKPMALTLADADRMISICKQKEVKLAVVHPHRFRPAMVVLKQMIERGGFGSLSHVNATLRWNRNQDYYDQAQWRGTKELDGGVLMNQAIHNIDLLLWLVGDVEEVSSFQATQVRDIEAEDTAVSILRFQNGVLGIVEAAVTVYPRNLEESIHLFGSDGTAQVGGPTAHYLHTWQFCNIPESEQQSLLDQVQVDPYGKPGHLHIIEDMTAAIRDHRSPLISGEEGRKALQLIVACYQSHAQKQTIRLSKPGKEVHL